MRKLVSVQKILDVRPIAGADMIEVVDVLGWSVVTQKANGFKPGDLVLYFEVDSFLNAEDKRFASFEERFSNWNGKRGMRLKTIKLRKQISQGLVLPLGDFQELFSMEAESFGVGRLRFNEGDDVTEILKIEKWEPAEEGGNLGGAQGAKTAGAKKFPPFIRKTDQERVQNYINELGKHTDETFEVSVKLDGSSMTVYHLSPDSNYYEETDLSLRSMLQQMSLLQCLGYWVKRAFGKIKPEARGGVCSRNIELSVGHGNHFCTYVNNHGLVNKLKTFNKNIAVQGELIGPSIQENYEKVDDFEFYVFSVFDIDARVGRNAGEVREICFALDLKTVPILHTAVSLAELTNETEPRAVVEKLLAFAEGPGMNKGVKREGVVFKSNETGFSFKAISNSYLLKKEGKQA